MTDAKPYPAPESKNWKCEACDGSKQAVPDCEACSGNGWVDDLEDGGTMTCPECNNDKCDVCNGTGERRRKAKRS